MPENTILCDESVNSGRHFFLPSFGSAPHDFLQITGGAIGLGFGCASALIQAGVNVVINARGKQALDHASTALNALASEYASAKDSEPKVVLVAADITTVEGRKMVFDRALELKIDFDIVMTNAGGPGSSRDLRVPISQRGGVTINDLLPGRFDTDRLSSSRAIAAAKAGTSEAEVESRQKLDIPARRFGTREEFGSAYAFLCSVHAAYITGQNLLIDGGMYPGTY